MSRIGQLAIAGRLTAGSSPNGAMVSSVMYRPRWTAHSSFCSNRIAPTRRMIATSFGKIPTTSVLRLISPLTRSIGLVGMQFGPMLSGEAHVREDVGLRFVEECGEFGQLGA